MDSFLRQMSHFAPCIHEHHATQMKLSCPVAEDPRDSRARRKAWVWWCRRTQGTVQAREAAACRQRRITRLKPPGLLPAYCAQSHVSRLRAELAAPYRALQECARTVATVARECRLEIDVEECVVFAQRGGPFSPPAPHFQPAF